MLYIVHLRELQFFQYPLLYNTIQYLNFSDVELLVHLVDDPGFEARQKARQVIQQNKQPKGSPGPPANSKPPKKKRVKKGKK
jgi:hypothetical protein